MDLTSIDYYLKPSLRPPKPFKAVLNVSDGNVDDADVNDKGDGKGDEPLGDDDVDTRLAHRPPTTEQVEPVEPNEPIGKYAQYFEEHCHARPYSSGSTATHASVTNTQNSELEGLIGMVK